MHLTKDGNTWTPMDSPSENVTMINVLITLGEQVIHETYIEQGWTLADVRYDMLHCCDLRDFKFCIDDKIIRPRVEMTYDFKGMYDFVTLVW